MAPTPRMRQLATRWLVDLVELRTQTTTATTRATMADGGVTLGPPLTYRALVRQVSLTDQDDVDQDRAVRDLSVWIDESASVSAGMRCTIVDADDSTLIGRHGTVLLVERDSVRAVRRLTVRMPNDE